MTTKNYLARNSGRNPFVFVLAGAVIGLVADLSFGLPMIGTGIGASFGLWAGAAVESIAETISNDIATA